MHRNGVQVHEGLLSSLKQFKQDVMEIEEDSECGIYIEEFDEWEENDVISAFELMKKRKINKDLPRLYCNKSKRTRTLHLG